MKVILIDLINEVIPLHRIYPIVGMPVNSNNGIVWVIFRTYFSVEFTRYGLILISQLSKISVSSGKSFSST